MDEPSAREEVRKAANDSARVVFPPHAEDRMAQRGITTADALRALKNGWIVEGPFQDQKGCWRVTLETRCEGQPLQVVAAICEDDNGNQIVVVTAFWPN